jgi:hypothetical protein
MISTARTELADAAQHDQLEEEQMGDQIVIANPRSRSFFANMTADMVMLKQKVEKLERETRFKQEQLELATLGFRDFRHRFISVYKRDMLPHEMDDNDKTDIRSGNNVVHGGNCKRDAELYSGHRPRYDHSVFEKLYGVRPETAVNIGK